MYMACASEREDNPRALESGIRHYRSMFKLFIAHAYVFALCIAIYNDI